MGEITTNRSGTFLSLSPLFIFCNFVTPPFCFDKSLKNYIFAL
nr:MAG TPA: hypothetical protein [Caudoviricetes sp.]